MWHKIISILCVINAFNSFSGAITLSTYNGSTLITSLNSVLSDLRSEQEQQATMIERFFSTMDIETLRAQLEQQGEVMREVIVDCKEKLTLTKTDIQFIRTGLEREENSVERQKKFINELVNVTDIIKSNITLLKVELEEQIKKHENIYKSDIQFVRSELEREGKSIEKQKKFINELVNVTDIMKSNITFLKAELEEQNKKHENIYKSDIQFLRTELEREGKSIEKQKKFINELVNVTDIIKSNITLLKVELEQQNKKHENIYKSDIQFVRSELEREGKSIEKQKKFINELVNVTDIIKSNITLLKVELEEQIKKHENIYKSDIQFLRTELEREGKSIEKQKKFINELVVKVTDVQSIKSYITFLKAELEQQNRKYETNYKSDIQSLKQGLEQQGQLINEQRLLIDKQEMLIGQLVKEHKPMFTWFSCSQARLSGIYDIVVSKFSTEPFPVVCDAETHGGGWTVILKRIDGSVDFYRKWTEYQKGFGNLDGEFFIGLDKLHALTTERTQELLIVLEDFEGDERFAKYDEFAISDEKDKYRLNILGSYSGTTGDSLDYQRGFKFSTFDNDNNEYSGNCAITFTGAWWYSSNCGSSNLAGKYKDNSYGKGVNWYYFRGYQYSLKKAIMMIRPRK